MSKELNCTWSFGLQDPANRKGPNNATTMSFKDEDFNSLVRESIQNSLDAVKDASKPVEVDFSLRKFSGLDFPNFFKLRDHIEGCLQMFPNNENAEKRFRPMLKYFVNNRFEQEIAYLRITDKNTKGMDYDENDHSSGFYKFLAEGIAQNKEGAGGAFGFGKDAFWALSPISTVFVSSRTENQVNFAGISKLCTHVIGNEEFVSNGQYSTNGQGLVVSDENMIPNEFLQKEIGSTIFVIGMNNFDKNALIRSVLRNYWMALYKEKLIVKVEQLTMCKENLAQLINEYFKECDELEEIKAYDYSTRDFYEILVGAESNRENYKYLEGFVQMNGKECGVKLYLHKYETYMNVFRQRE